jgi:hypothetical protein
MRALFTTIAAVALAACGAEVATTAATGAAIKKQEIEAGENTKENVQKKLDAAAEAMRLQTEQQENSYK